MRLQAFIAMWTIVDFYSFVLIQSLWGSLIGHHPSPLGGLVLIHLEVSWNGSTPNSSIFILSITHDGSTYAILIYINGNIYHKYTPFMLVYIPAPWIRHGIIININHPQIEVPFMVKPPSETRGISVNIPGHKKPLRAPRCFRSGEDGSFGVQPGFGMTPFQFQFALLCRGGVFWGSLTKGRFTGGIPCCWPSKNRWDLHICKWMFLPFRCGYIYHIIYYVVCIVFNFALCIMYYYYHS